MTKYYRLDENNNPVECDRDAWDSADNHFNSVVNSTKIGRYIINTAFVGVDYLFATTIIDDWGKESRKVHAKYSTWEAAKVGHEKTVEYVGSELVPF
ncbi:hypothetical protein C7B80_11980 [Cyanosarcina cf. burmensis CCALA 770]|nr:hypothetical protein C7B80_11980 [Cyanosarcina cf. burmensis CCALA 770]